MNTPETDAKSPILAGVLITVAICTRNRVRFLQRAVESVLPQMTDEMELLIVDNASTDNTLEVATRLVATHPRVKVWHEKELGLSAARNAALNKALGQYVLFLDDDATAEPDWLGAYQRFLSKPPSERIAVVGGAVFPEFEVPPPKWTNTDIAFDLGDSQKRFPYRDSPWGGNSAYWREPALAVGMFDTRLGRKGKKMMSREESDLNLRLQDAGYEVWWLPGAAIRHFVPASRLAFSATMLAWFAGGRSIAIQRLKSRHNGWDRELFRAGRIVAAPFHILIHLLAALIMLPLSYPKSVGHLFQICRNCGLAWQLLVETTDAKTNEH